MTIDEITRRSNLKSLYEWNEIPGQRVTVLTEPRRFDEYVLYFIARVEWPNIGFTEYVIFKYNDIFREVNRANTFKKRYLAEEALDRIFALGS